MSSTLVKPYILILPNIRRIRAGKRGFPIKQLFIVPATAFEISKQGTVLREYLQRIF